MKENDDYCRLTPVSDTEPLSLLIEPMFQLTMEALLKDSHEIFAGKIVPDVVNYC